MKQGTFEELYDESNGCYGEYIQCPHCKTETVLNDQNGFMSTNLISLIANSGEFVCGVCKNGFFVI